MRKGIISVFSTLLLVAVIVSTAFITSMPGIDDLSLKANDESVVKWYTFEEAVEINKKAPRKIFVDVYTDWCGWCKKMDVNTFNNPTVAEYLNEKYYPVKFNAEQRESIVFRDHTFKFIAQGARGYHELAAALLNNKLSYPTVVFLDEDFNMIQPLPGYQQPNTFYPIIEFFGDDHYKKMNWQEFQKIYKSPF